MPWLRLPLVSADPLHGHSRYQPVMPLSRSLKHRFPLVTVIHFWYGLTKGNL